MKIEIKNRYTGAVSYSYDCQDNTLARTVQQAVLDKISLCGADLRDANLYGANLYGANLYDADLCDANLRGANLRDANLRGAYLRCADLYGAYLRDADLCDANLYGANLYDADLCDANLRGANLCDANLRGANLRDANLRDADLRGAKNIPYIPLACPSDGEFFGWKKVNGLLVQLKIPADARRSSATTSKCRCDKALVSGIYNLDGSVAEVRAITNTQYEPLTYAIGNIIYPDSFDENRWNECSHGIHFFINKQEAIEY